MMCQRNISLGKHNDNTFFEGVLFRLSIMLSIVLVYFSTVFVCYASESGSSEKFVRVATLDEYPPYCFPRETKKGFQETVPPGEDSVNLQGYSWDILRESFHAMGYTIHLSVYPWKRAVYD
ncbi:MAG: hypothetical protein HQK66_09380, partial [Desulfamplus sp.]|nr:hypothetical protein [Desulfamplus sp.]